MKLTLETVTNGVTIRIEEEYDPEKEWIKRGIAVTQLKRVIYELNKKQDTKKMEEKYQEPTDADWDSLMEDIDNVK